jgi:hypothetical protein
LIYFLWIYIGGFNLIHLWKQYHVPFFCQEIQEHFQVFDHSENSIRCLILFIYQILQQFVMYPEIIGFSSKLQPGIVLKCLQVISGRNIVADCIVSPSLESG